MPLVGARAAARRTHRVEVNAHGHAQHAHHGNGLVHAAAGHAHIPAHHTQATKNWVHRPPMRTHMSCLPGLGLQAPRIAGPTTPHVTPMYLRTICRVGHVRHSNWMNPGKRPVIPNREAWWLGLATCGAGQTYSHALHNVPAQCAWLGSHHSPAAAALWMNRDPPLSQTATHIGSPLPKPPPHGSSPSGWTRTLRGTHARTHHNWPRPPTHLSALAANSATSDLTGLMPCTASTASMQEQVRPDELDRPLPARRQGSASGCRSGGLCQQQGGAPTSAPAPTSGIRLALLVARLQGQKASWCTDGTDSASKHCLAASLSDISIERRKRSPAPWGMVPWIMTCRPQGAGTWECLACSSSYAPCEQGMGSRRVMEASWRVSN